MKETSTKILKEDRIHSWATVKANGSTHRSLRKQDLCLLPVSNLRTNLSAQHLPTDTTIFIHSNNLPLASARVGHDGSTTVRRTPNVADILGTPSVASPQALQSGAIVEAGDDKAPRKHVTISFLLTTKKILLWSKINVLLAFVPVGIATHFVDGLAPGFVFAMNAIGIIPLAGILSYSTESIARRMGDAVGALLNVTFGNAVELIIISALAKNEIRVVQSSLLGSVLANLLLIMGLSFFLGGLRFREQIYNSRGTQTSACLLSLSGISLVLPTAFHASFKDIAEADRQSLRISRGTSVVLLLVYVIYLLFQLKSHAYMYISTPQHIIDEEATPGPAANWLDSYSSGSNPESDSDSSGHSRTTISERVKRAIRGTRRRKSSLVSAETSQSAPHNRSPSFGVSDVSPPPEDHYAQMSPSLPRLPPQQPSVDSNQVVVEDQKSRKHAKRRHHHHRKKHGGSKKPNHGSQEVTGQNTILEKPEMEVKVNVNAAEPRRVEFALGHSKAICVGDGAAQDTSNRRPFTGVRGISLLPMANSLTPSIFVQPSAAAAPPVPTSPVPRARYGIRRTNSLPDRLNSHHLPNGPVLAAQLSASAIPAVPITERTQEMPQGELSRTSAILCLLTSTCLVAVCAEFMVDSIDGLVKTHSLRKAFIGLIILPIVGNAAEHVTAIAGAMRNKMDLSIGVAIGSSIQIALFITPLIVILGWCMSREMTLYFSLFETVCLFVSTFIVNFLVLDGRSNYLEGALLCATYVIISVVAFFYPDQHDASGHQGAGQL